MSLPVLFFLLVLPLTLSQPSPYNPHDLSAISLYGPDAVYAPEMCPPSFTFSDRARFLPELASNKIGIFPSDIRVNDRKCKADATMLVFVPIGNTKHYPPQWHFEDSRYTGRPVNFTCGEYEFAIRFGYFNDVSTEATEGFLDAQVVYLDFAVIPNSKPFGFCSYSAQRIDHDRPLDHAPFPTKKTWNKLKAIGSGLHKKNVPEVPMTNNVPTPVEEPTPTTEAVMDKPSPSPMQEMTDEELGP